MYVTMETDVVIVQVTGSFQFVCAMGQQLAWLGAVCRLPSNGLRYCVPVFTRSKRENFNRPIVEIRYDIVAFDEDEIILCWHSLMADSVIATGFPIAERSDEDKGLQIPIEVMAAIAGVSMAFDIGSGFILKGDTIAFIPVEKRGDHVQWHLLDGDGEPLGHNFLGSSDLRPLPQNAFNDKEVNSSIAFLGWAPNVRNYAGTYTFCQTDFVRKIITFSATDELDYSLINWSRSCETPEMTISLTGASISFSKIVGAGLNFAIGRKQFLPTLRTITDYDDILNDLRDRRVIFYDTATKRGWLIDAERATLQIILHRTKAETSYTESTTAFQIADPNQLSSAASAMKSNKRVQIGKSWDSVEGKDTIRWFSTLVKEIREELVALNEKGHSEFQRCYPRTDIHCASPGFVGFEYMALVEKTSDLQPMKVEPANECGAWPTLACDLHAVILLGQNFQELLLPCDTVSLCPNFQRLPSERSYLAVEVTKIKELLRRNSEDGYEKRLTASNIMWVTSEDVFQPCKWVNGEKCSCRRVQQLSKTHKGCKPENFSELYADGAIIFGARMRNRLERRRRLSRLTTTPQTERSSQNCEG
jgi:hypothetical protein